VLVSCPTCRGSGRIGSPCHACHGARVIEVPTPLVVRVPSGVENGERIRVPKESVPNAQGDIVLQIQVRPHPFFRREGLDLVVTLPVTVSEAYKGTTIAIPSPDGSRKVRIPPHAQSGTRLRFRGQGVARSGKRGDLYADLSIRVPDAESPE